MMRLPLAAGRGPLADLSQRPAKVSWIPWDFFWGGNPPEKPGGTSDIYILYIYIYIYGGFNAKYISYTYYISVRFASPFDDCDVMTHDDSSHESKGCAVVPIIESCATAVGLCRDVQMHIYSLN